MATLKKRKNIEETTKGRQKKRQAKTTLNF